jgi:hypothetical protein
VYKTINIEKETYMRKYLTSLVVVGSLVATMLFPGTTSAAQPTNWDLMGNHTVAFVCTAGCTGTYTHNLNVSSMDMNTGAFSGTGSFSGDPAITWNIMGNVTGNAVTFSLVYTGTGAGYTVNGTGTVGWNGMLSGTGTSNSGQSFDWSTTSGKAKLKLGDAGQLNKEACGENAGKLMVNVVQRVNGDIDSGNNGYWATDIYTRHIKVWKLNNTPAETVTTAVAEPAMYCTVITYNGGFFAQGGKHSPGANNITLPHNIGGSMKGGYRATFTGTFDPMLATHGSIGNYDYACNIDTTNCPGYVDILGQYFGSYTDFEYGWWGWIYTTQGNKHGTWINSVDGSYGDIN